MKTRLMEKFITSQNLLIDSSLYNTKRKKYCFNSKKLSNIGNKLVWYNEDPVSLPNSGNIFNFKIIKET